MNASEFPSPDPARLAGAATGRAGGHQARETRALARLARPPLTRTPVLGLPVPAGADHAANLAGKHRAYKISYWAVYGAVLTALAAGVVLLVVAVRRRLAR